MITEPLHAKVEACLKRKGLQFQKSQDRGRSTHHFRVEIKNDPEALMIETAEENQHLRISFCPLGYLTERTASIDPDRQQGSLSTVITISGRVRVQSTYIGRDYKPSETEIAGMIDRVAELQTYYEEKHNAAIDGIEGDEEELRQMSSSLF